MSQITHVDPAAFSSGFKPTLDQAYAISAAVIDQEALNWKRIRTKVQCSTMGIVQ